jgi:serine/threonine-protein kinase
MPDDFDDASSSDDAVHGHVAPEPPEPAQLPLDIEFTEPEPLMPVVEEPAAEEPDTEHDDFPVIASLDDDIADEPAADEPVTDEPAEESPAEEPQVAQDATAEPLVPEPLPADLAAEEAAEAAAAESPMLAESEPRGMDLGPEKRGVWIWGVIAALVVIGAAVAGIMYYRSATAPVLVPAVTGKLSAQATQALNDAGVRLGEITSEATSTAPVGTVIGQDPKAGTSVSRQTAVSIVVAAKPDVATVPDVTGRPRDDAEATLAAERLRALVVESYSTTVAAGTVIGQTPKGSVALPPGAGVAVMISRGVEPSGVLVPNLSGIRQPEAVSILAALGLQAMPTRSVTASFQAGDIAAQDPKAGMSVRIGTPVLYWVSDGKGLVSASVPQAIAHKQADAETSMKKAGLQVRSITVVDKKVPAGVVISQMPPANARVAKNTLVTLVVSKGDFAGYAVPDLMGKSSQEASGALGAAGFQPVLFGVPSKSAAGTIFGQFPGPNSLWPSGLPAIAIYATPE